MSVTQSTIQTWNGPTATLPALREFEPGADEADPDDVDDDYGFEVIDYPDPITHGVGVDAVLNDGPDGADYRDDPDTVYRRLLAAWREHVEEPDREPYVVVENAHRVFEFADDDYPAHLCLKSSGWKVGTDATGTGVENQRFEYSLQLVRYDPEDDDLLPTKPLPVNFQTWVRPQEEGLVYKSGDELALPFGTGTKFHTQTTYAEPLAAVNRTMQVVTVALEALGRDRPDWSALNRDSLKVWKAEVHHRILKDLMSVACGTLDQAKRLINYGGGAEMEQHSKRAEAGRVRELVRADRWDRLGFVQPDGLELAVKVYRSSNWHAYRDETYKHPKVEAFLAGTANDQQLPHVREWSALRSVLRQLATGICVRSGVAMGDLVQDDYYDAWERDLVDVPIPMGWRSKLEEANEERERQIYRQTMSSLSRARWDVLWTVAQYEGATYDQLQEVTGLSRDYIREIVRELEDEEILARLTWPRLIVYHNEELRVNAIELLQNVHPDEGLHTIKERAEERRERREQRRQQAAQDGDDAEDGDGSGSAVDGDSGASSDPTSDEEPFAEGTWHRFDELEVLSPEELRNALERDYVDGAHVAVRTDHYDWLDPGG